jgi:hypothetical protein
MSSQQRSDQFQFRRFAPSFEALGIVVDFLSREAPYDEFRAGKLVTALKHQVMHGHHVCAFRGEKLVGYCGWLPISEELGTLWVAGKAELTPVPPDRADAVALTTIRVDDPKVLHPLIRACRKLHYGKRVFYLGRRLYAGQRSPQRRESIFNFSSE